MNIWLVKNDKQLNFGDNWITLSRRKVGCARSIRIWASRVFFRFTRVHKGRQSPQYWVTTHYRLILRQLHSLSPFVGSLTINTEICSRKRLHKIMLTWQASMKTSQLWGATNFLYLRLSHIALIISRARLHVINQWFTTSRISLKVLKNTRKLGLNCVMSFWNYTSISLNKHFLYWNIQLSLIN